MRYTIWEKDDFFEVGGKRIDMDPSVVLISYEVPLTWNFDWEDARGPYGRVFDIRIEDGEITGEVEFFDPSWDDELLKSCRFAGYYTKVKKNRYETEVTKCKLQGVSLVPLAGFPKAK